MNELTQDLSLAQARSLIDSYDFDLGRNNVESLFEYWLDLYHANWIRLATIEALYLGRYKGVSVEQILNVWQRLGSPNPHFTYEFERLICRKLPKHLSNLSDLTASVTETDSDSSAHSLADSDRHPEPRQEKVAQPEPPSINSEVVTSEREPNLEKTFSDLTAKSDSLISSWGLPSKSDWKEFTGGRSTIHQFIPLPDVSSFFTRLKTFGEEKPEG